MCGPEAPTAVWRLKLLRRRGAGWRGRGGPCAGATTGGGDCSEDLNDQCSDVPVGAADRDGWDGRALVHCPLCYSGRHGASLGSSNDPGIRVERAPAMRHKPRRALEPPGASHKHPINQRPGRHRPAHCAHPCAPLHAHGMVASRTAPLAAFCEGRDACCSARQCLAWGGEAQARAFHLRCGDRLWFRSGSERARSCLGLPWHGGSKLVWRAEGPHLFAMGGGAPCRLRRRVAWSWAGPPPRAARRRQLTAAAAGRRRRTTPCGSAGGVSCRAAQRPAGGPAEACRTFFVWAAAGGGRLRKQGRRGGGLGRGACPPCGPLQFTASSCTMP